MSSVCRSVGLSVCPSVRLSVYLYAVMRPINGWCLQIITGTDIRTTAVEVDLPLTIRERRQRHIGLVLPWARMSKIGWCSDHIIHPTKGRRLLHSSLKEVFYGMLLHAGKRGANGLVTGWCGPPTPRHSSSRSRSHVNALIGSRMDVRLIHLVCGIFYFSYFWYFFPTIHTKCRLPDRANI